MAGFTCIEITSSVTEDSVVSKPINRYPTKIAGNTPSINIVSHFVPPGTLSLATGKQATVSTVSERALNAATCLAFLIAQTAVIPPKRKDKQVIVAASVLLPQLELFPKLLRN